MKFSIAYQQIIDAITGLDDFPAPGLDPVQPSEHRFDRMLFIEISPSYTGRSEDITISFQQGDPKGTHDMESTARVTIHVHVRLKDGDPHKSILICQKYEAVQDAIRALSASDDTDFTCHVDDVALDVPKDADWASARMGVAVGAFQD